MAGTFGQNLDVVFHRAERLCREPIPIGGRDTFDIRIFCGLWEPGILGVVSIEWREIGTKTSRVGGSFAIGKIIPRLRPGRGEPAMASGAIEEEEYEPVDRYGRSHSVGLTEIREVE